MPEGVKEVDIRLVFEGERIILAIYLGEGIKASNRKPRREKDEEMVIPFSELEDDKVPASLGGRGGITLTTRR